MSRVGPLRYGDPTEGVRPIRISGLKNGVYAGELVVGSRKVLKGLKTVVSDLKQAMRSSQQRRFLLAIPPVPTTP